MDSVDALKGSLRDFLREEFKKASDFVTNERAQSNTVDLSQEEETAQVLISSGDAVIDQVVDNIVNSSIDQLDMSDKGALDNARNLIEKTTETLDAIDQIDAKDHAAVKKTLRKFHDAMNKGPKI